jgi:hypothetical protein
VAEDAPTSPRRPGYFQIPLNWREMSEVEKHARALQFVQAEISVSCERRSTPTRWKSPVYGHVVPGRRGATADREGLDAWSSCSRLGVSQ